MSTPVSSTFGNKNHAAVFFDMIIPLALISMLTSKSYKKHIASFAYTSAVTFILLAKTKGSILGYIAFTLLFLFFIYKNKFLKTHLFQKKRIVHYLTLSFIVPMLIYTLTTVNFVDSHTPTEWNAGLTKSSASTRLSWYKNAIAMFEASPLIGVGYGSFRVGFAPYASTPNSAHNLTEDEVVKHLHNDPYQNFLELGIIGGGLIVIIFCYIIIKGTYFLATTYAETRNSSYYLFLGSFLALISSITHSFVDFPMRLPSSAVLFWFLTGLILLFLSKQTSKVTLISHKNSITMGIFLFILSVILIAHSYNLYYRYTLASKFTYLASVSIQKEKNCLKGKNEIDQAVNLFFGDAFIRQRYVQIYIDCSKNPQVILSAMNRVLNYDSTNARARLTRAILLLEKNKLRLAHSDFSYLSYVLPHRPAAYLGLGDIATLSKKFILARKYYEKAKSLDPSNEKATFMLNQFTEKGI